MEKEIFRIGDKVFDIIFGWGEVKSVSKNGEPIVFFKNIEGGIACLYTANGKSFTKNKHPMLSFTEYTLQGFSQERPIDYKDYIGKRGKFWNDNPKYFTIGILKGYEQGGHKPFQSVSLDFQNFQPLTDEQIKVLGLKND